MISKFLNWLGVKISTAPHDPTFVEWLAFGVEQEWVSEPVCQTHEGVPVTVTEAAEQEEGDDPCIVALRIWPDDSLDK